VGGKESQCGFGVPRASREKSEVQKYEAEDFGGKDFRKVCIIYVRLPHPPVRTHQTSLFLGEIIKR